MAENGCNFLRLNRATTVFIEKFEGGKHVRLAEQLNLVDSGSAPLAKVNLAAAINIGLIENLVGAIVNLCLIKLRVQSAIGLEEFRALDQSIAILIKLIERLTEFLLLLLCRQVTRHKCQSRLL